MISWTSPRNLPDFVAAPIYEAVERMLSQHLLPPRAGKVLNLDKAYNRLQNYNFSQGFCIVITSALSIYIGCVCIHCGHSTVGTVWCRWVECLIVGRKENGEVGKLPLPRMRLALTNN